MDNLPLPYKPLASERCWQRFCVNYDDEWFLGQQMCYELTLNGNKTATRQWNAWMLYAATAKLLGEA